MPTMTCALVERLQTIADPRRQGENLKHLLGRYYHLRLLWGARGL